MLSGQTLGAEEALAIGLVDKVVPYEQLDAAIAETIAEGRTDSKPSPFLHTHDRWRSSSTGTASMTLLAGSAPASDDPRVAKAVKRIGTKAPIALRLAAELIDRGADLIDRRRARAGACRTSNEIFATKDAYEGLSSLGKRTPVFTGR